jgi:hypothetical protein
MATLTVDVGSWVLEKRKLQAAVDAAALAGASHLPAGFSVAQTSAGSYFAKNTPIGTATVSNTSTYTTNDSVKVAATAHVQSFFAGVFGHTSTTINVSATASVRTVTSYASTGNVMPFGVMKDDFHLGTQYTLYSDADGSPHNGALSLDLVSGNVCVQASGANDIRNTVNGTQSACKLTVGDTLDAKPGQNAGPVSDGLNTRMSGGWQTFNQVVTAVGNNEYVINAPTSKQLVIIPIVTNTAGGNTWPVNGNGTVRLVGFAYFVITGCGTPSKPGPCSTSDGRTVNGTFVNIVDSDTAGGSTAWDPTSGSVISVALSN